MCGLLYLFDCLRRPTQTFLCSVLQGDDAIYSRGDILEQLRGPFLKVRSLSNAKAGSDHD